MKHFRLSDKKWYNAAVVVCIGVVLFVVLTRLDTVLRLLGTFIGYFKTVIVGAVIAYTMSPLVKFFYYRVFKSMKVGKGRWCLSVAVSFVLMLGILLVLTGMLIPQLVQSLAMLSNNFDSYASTLIQLIEASPLNTLIAQEQLDVLSQNAIGAISNFVRENAQNIISIAADSGKGIVGFVIAMILAVYLLIDVKRILTAIREFFQLTLSKESFERLLDFVLRCDTILVDYIVQSVIESVIISAITAIFMAFMRMPYIGLISVVAGVTNLIPNFGPVIGYVVGGFILLLIDPVMAVAYVIFSIILQVVDGYILKPRIFADSMGVSGVVILAATIVFGNMFDLVGILLAIPFAAVLSFIYRDYYVPWRKARNHALAAAEAVENGKESAADAEAAEAAKLEAGGSIAKAAESAEAAGDAVDVETVKLEAGGNTAEAAKAVQAAEAGTPE